MRKQFITFIAKDVLGTSYIDLPTLEESSVSLTQEMLEKGFKYYIPLKNTNTRLVLPEKIKGARKDTADYIGYLKYDKWRNMDGTRVRKYNKSDFGKEIIESVEKQLGCTLDDCFYISDQFPILKKTNTEWLGLAKCTYDYINTTGLPSIAIGQFVSFIKSDNVLNSYEQVKMLLNVFNSKDASTFKMYKGIMYNMDLRSNPDYIKLLYILLHNAYDDVFLTEFVCEFDPEIHDVCKYSWCNLDKPATYVRCYVDYYSNSGYLTDYDTTSSINNEVNKLSKLIDQFCKSIRGKEKTDILKDYKQRLISSVDEAKSNAKRKTDSWALGESYLY